MTAHDLSWSLLNGTKSNAHADVAFRPDVLASQRHIFLAVKSCVRYALNYLRN